MLFTVTAIVSFFDLKSISEQYKKILYWMMVVIYIFISATRWNNPDWNVYYLSFMENKDLDDFLQQELDPGFMVVYWMIKSFTDEFSIALTILAFIIIGIHADFMRRFSPYPLFSLLFWYGTYIGEIFFNRQALAIAITLIAFRYIVTSKPLIFILLTLLASTMQISTVVFLLAYPIYHLRMNIAYGIFFLIFSMLGGYFLGSSALLSIGTLIQFLGINQERLMTKVSLYYETGASDGGYMLWGYIRRLIFVPIEVWAIPYLTRNVAYFKGCVQLIFFGYGLYFLLRNVSPTVASRTSSPFYFYEVIAIPSLFLLIKSIYARIAFFAVLVLYSLIKYIYAIQMYEDIYVPYVNIIFSGVR